MKKTILAFFMLSCIWHITYGQIRAPSESSLQPVFYPETGHSDSLSAVAISSDGLFAFSAGGDHTIRMWNLRNGKEMRLFQGHTRGVTSIDVSNDARLILSGSIDGTVRLWDIETGLELKCLIGHKGYVTSVDFSPDCKYAASLESNGTVILWNLTEAKAAQTFNGTEEYAQSLSFSPDGSYIASGGNEGVIRMWPVQASGKPRILPGHAYQDRICGINSVEFSPDGKYLLSTAASDNIKLCLADSGKVVRPFTGGNKQHYSAAFSPDGRFIASADGDYITLWNAQTGMEIRRFIGNTGTCITPAFSQDGKLLLSGGYDQSLSLWNVSDGRLIAEMRSQVRPVKAVVSGKRGEYLISGGFDNTLKIWNIAAGRLENVLAGHIEKFNGISAVAISPDGESLLSGTIWGEVILWDLPTQKKLYSLKADSNITCLSFSLDGRRFFSAGTDKSVRSWDTATGKMLREFTRLSDDIRAMTLSKDGRYIFTGGWLSPIIMFDAQSGLKVRSASGDVGGTASLSLSPDGRHLLAGRFAYTYNDVERDTVTYWDIDSGSGKSLQNYHATISTVAFSPDGLLFCTGSDDSTVKIWQTKTGTCLKTLTGHGDAVTQASFTPDGRFVISASDDGTVRVWDINTGHWVALIVNKYGSRWLIFTDDGYWDGSPNCGELVAMVRGMEVWNIDQFAVSNNRPDIILQRLGSMNKELIAHYYSQYLKRLRKLGLTEDKLSEDYIVPEAKIIEAKQDGKFINLKFSLADTKYRLKRYNIYVNDVPLFGSYGREITGNSLTLTERVELTSGENKIEISAMNEKGAESFRALTYAKYNTPFKGDLYFIGFGISQYKNSALNLSYAHKDVLDLAKLFSGMKGRFANVFIRTFVNEQATVENIKKAKDLLKNAKPDDTFVLFISGHGVHDTDPEATYYYVTYETDINNLAGTAANFDLIEDLLQGIPPRNKLFLMDTCESGEAEESVQAEYLVSAEKKGIKSRAINYTRGLTVAEKPPVRTYLAEKDRYIYNDLARRSGAIVFSSCRGGEFSYEDARLQNGFFTAKIIEALKGQAADKNKDEIVSTDELREYVCREVPKLTADETYPEGLQHPTVDRDNIFQKFGF